MAQNYSEDLLGDLRRRKFIQEFFPHPERYIEDLEKLEGLNRLPSFVKAVITPLMVNRQKKVHYGQVVPIEEVERIFGFVNSVIRLPCICRQATVGTEQRYCYGISMVPQEQSQMGQLIRSIDADYLTGPGTAGLETLPKEESLFILESLKRRSFVTRCGLLSPPS